MQQSNTYVLIFTAILTVILAGLLSGSNQLLKPLQDKQVDLDTKKQILNAVLDISAIEDPNEILALYKKRVSSMVVDINGNTVEKDRKGNPIEAEKVNIQKNYKTDQNEREYPVFMLMNENNPDQIDAYIFPMFGAGLWDWIAGYVAVEKDLNTIKGASFSHKQETPGLGARITSAEIQGRYVGKKIFEGSELVSVTMVKGEGIPGLNEHQVDGMSGATLTGKGVNAMLKHYLTCYQAFISKVKAENRVAIN